MRAVTIRLWPENEAKMQEVVEKTGVTQTEFVNRAIADAAIIGIAESKTIAAGFLKMCNALNAGKLGVEDRKEVKTICQSFTLLMEKIEAFRS